MLICAVWELNFQTADNAMENFLQKSLDLKEFVSSAVKLSGGTVKKIEENLLEIHIPDDTSEDSQHSKRLKKVAFDPEVALDYPDSEFLTFGSPILENIISLSSKRGLVSQFYITGLNLEYYQLIKQVKRNISLGNCDISSYTEKVFMFYYLLFNFKTTYLSDEKEEEIRSIIIDMSNGQVSRQIFDLITEDNISEKEYYSFPDYPLKVDTLKAYIMARQKIEKKIIPIIKDKQNSLIKRREKEINIINNFYDDTKDEIEESLNKQDLSDEKKKMILDRLKLIEIERERRITELKDKYKIETSLELINSAIISQPKIVFQSKLDGEKLSSVVDLIWNPLTQSMEPVLCSKCLQPTLNLYLKRGTVGQPANVVCENCK